MTVEEELRGALDVPAPPPVTTLDDVLRRGRRRLFARRAGAVLSTLAVVAIIGFGGAVWSQAGPAVPTGSPKDWEPASDVMRKLLDPDKPNMGCGTQMPGVPMARAFGAVAFNSEQLTSWWEKAQVALPQMTVAPVVIENGTNIYEYQVTDSRGTGSVRWSAGRYTGGPYSSADEAMWEAGTCKAPRRAIAGDGTIYQLYDEVSYTLWDTNTQESALSKVQRLHIYRPDGLAIRIDQLSVVPTDLKKRRQSVPLSEDQLVRLGHVVAAVA